METEKGSHRQRCPAEQRSHKQKGQEGPHGTDERDVRHRLKDDGATAARAGKTTNPRNQEKGGQNTETTERPRGEGWGERSKDQACKPERGNGIKKGVWDAKEESARGGRAEKENSQTVEREKWTSKGAWTLKKKELRRRAGG